MILDSENVQVKAGIFIVHLKELLVRIFKFLLMLVALLRNRLTICMLVNFEFYLLILLKSILVPNYIEPP